MNPTIHQYLFIAMHYLEPTQRPHNYFHYLLTNFNIVSIVGDYNGGVQFINSVNESKLFKDDKIKIGVIEAKFDDLTKYDESLLDAKRQYQDGKICYLRTPTSGWIRQGNENVAEKLRS